ncbi:hypothetical protein BDP55DRAFT_90466 [Colletotrichum godetiae]|uniref:Uncharacterized protein n=1 Tax=Colletotrichum godetiae TaxID=1209918 RepID=A0AAJ0AQZ2_9PEZI|nr:uncharacterized protein BDP55DRAFT_90466 [Colletotrichum godetiae]KAK1687301.1 hypothetical protein BDP55DRAFT_90466 [Colletotrichum godetiae]
MPTTSTQTAYAPRNTAEKGSLGSFEITLRDASQLQLNRIRDLCVGVTARQMKAGCYPASPPSRQNRIQHVTATVQQSIRQLQPKHTQTQVFWSRPCYQTYQVAVLRYTCARQSITDIILALRSGTDSVALIARSYRPHTNFSLATTFWFLALSDLSFVAKLHLSADYCLLSARQDREVAFLQHARTNSSRILHDVLQHPSCLHACIYSMYHCTPGMDGNLPMP